MIKNFDEMVLELVKIETSPSSHEDYVEDYKNEREYYLSNCKNDSYIGYVRETMQVDEETALKLQKAVCSEINGQY